MKGLSFLLCQNISLDYIFFSKIDFSIDEIPYIIENKMTGINNDMHRLRVVSISLTNGLKNLATHVDYSWYNPFAMRAIEEYLNKNSSCIDVIIGDFNSGYIEDSLDISTGELVFHAGYLYFNRYENLGFVDPLKGKNEFTFISQRSKRRFRIDHCFIKNTEHSVRYIDYFLNKCISDHKAILVTI